LGEIFSPFLFLYQSSLLMAFPLAPTIGQLHTEVDIVYEWTGSSWDLDVQLSQELSENLVDPTPADVASNGAVWRNTVTGEAWEYSSNVIGGGNEWVKIVSDGYVEISGVQPTAQPDGTESMPGDIWIDSANSNVAYYRTLLGAWSPLTIGFDNTAANLASNPTTTQQAIDDIANRISALAGVLSFVGTYNASTDSADFTATSGLVDGPLPAASVANKDTYLIVDAAGTPATGPLAGTAMNPGDWVISDGTNWTHLNLSSNITSFLSLPDTPSSYAGQGGKSVYVDPTATSLIFADSSDTNSIVFNTAPTSRDPGLTNTVPLQEGDRWVDSTTLNTYVRESSTWNPIVPVIFSETKPVETQGGLLWYKPSVGTLFVRDSTASAWVGI
jgi:hypothetical protein